MGAPARPKAYWRAIGPAPELIAAFDHPVQELQGFFQLAIDGEEVSFGDVRMQLRGGVLGAARELLELV